MFKLFAFLTIITFVASAQVPQLNQKSDNSLEDYINQNRAIHAENIRNYDKLLEALEKKYKARLSTSDVRLNLLKSSLDRTHQNLNYLKILSDLSSKCVNKYQSKVPSVSETEFKFARCWTNAYIQQDYLLLEPLNTRNNLESYYNNNFEYDIDNCKWLSGDYYYNCVVNAVSNANIYTYNNQITFTAQMTNAQYNADQNIRKALECSYSTQEQSLSSAAEGNTLIKKCLEGLDDCKQCQVQNQVNTCSEIYYIPRSEVSYSSPVMANPFYQNYRATDCLMMKIY